jgi:hypothetical protein
MTVSLSKTHLNTCFDGRQKNFKAGLWIGKTVLDGRI